MQGRRIAERAIERLRKTASKYAPLFDTSMLDDLLEDLMSSIEWTYDQRRKEIIENVPIQRLPQKHPYERVRAARGRFVKRHTRDGSSGFNPS